MSVFSLAQVMGIGLAGSVAEVVGIRNSYFATSALLAVIAAAGWWVVSRRSEAAAVSA
jgi:hypothetical protein